MVNPFDLRTIFLARHAQHVVLVHFPIALFITGVALDLLPHDKRESKLASAAYLNITVAAVTVIPAVTTGLLAWQFALEGKRLKGLLLFHVVAASVSAILVLISWWIQWRMQRSESPALRRIRIPVELSGVGVIALTAHLGGFLSGVNS
jgi:uncharacterized membrane protein